MITEEKNSHYEKWSVDDFIQEQSAGQFDISPDGKWCVWVKSTPDKDKDGMVHNLILSSLREKKEFELTRGSELHSDPKWSPDGTQIAFLSSRPLPKGKNGAKEEGSKNQIWLMATVGGEPWPVTEMEKGIEGFQWTGKDSIVFTSAEDSCYYESKIKTIKDNSWVVEDDEHAAPVRFFKLDIPSRTIKRLTENKDRISVFSVSPDGSKALAVHNQSLRYGYDQKIPPVVVLYDFEKQNSQEILGGLRIYPEVVRWTKEGFYFSSRLSNHPQYVIAAIAVLHYYDIATKEAISVDLKWAKGLASTSHYELTQDGFIALLADGLYYKAARYYKEGSVWKQTFLEGEHLPYIFFWTLSASQSDLIYAFSKPDLPTQWYHAVLENQKIQNPKLLTELNPHYKKRRFARAESLRWQGSQNEEVEGILFYPHDYKAEQKYPLVVMIHGGPAANDLYIWQDSWKHQRNILAQKGAFVFTVNYHGSSNYGLDWLTSISNGKYYDLELEDIEKGVDFLIARGLVDPDRLGLCGWSNGAVLGIAMTTRTSRYKAAVTGAGDVEWVSDWGNCSFGAVFDQFYFGASPLSNTQLYWEKSPFFRMKEVKTPTLIFFGTEDRFVPTQQGWMHYRALQQETNTPVRFILFPGAPHGLQRLTHQKRKALEEIAWFEKHLFQTQEKKHEALKSDSPLAMSIQRKKIAKTGKYYGVLYQGHLIPETVLYKDVLLGRFEVTRAQYAAFDPAYPVEEGTDNYPANGISFEEAQAYCAWLSRLTKETYRLGKESEMKAIYESAKEGENTLDYWAGYKVNPDDAKVLLLMAQDLPGKSPLLKEVGSFKAVSEDTLVFDLGGNVAEWVIDQEGKGKPIGGSADCPCDKKGHALASLEYTGIRVVKNNPRENHGIA
ncbi:MAG: prolyl oligopeptidase family serine peptidase [Candidatus Brocadiae bacterium]|nr:prolyl oligopeptidase family serine peptidase [Candidatus Brocadiia bacterium]